MSQTSPALGLPFIQPAQAQKHVTHNEALVKLDAIVQLTVIDAGVLTPPPDPSAGDRYLVGDGATGEWADQAGQIALWEGAFWVFHMPQPGWAAYSLTDQQALRFDGTHWQPEGSGDSADIWGVNTTADTTNRLSVRSAATLLTHEGAGHQVKINKSASGETSSLLFQTDWMGRAEMGTAGTDNFAIKVSADGQNWITAIEVDAATGLPTGSAVQASPTDVAQGKLARADYAYSPGNLVGSVTESAGVPTGAVIERGENANGEYVRFADGTQICWSLTYSVDVTIAAGALYRSGVVSWVFPAAFSEAPAMVQGRQNHSTIYWTVPGVTSLTGGDACAMSYQSINSRALNLVAMGRWF